MENVILPRPGVHCLKSHFALLGRRPLRNRQGRPGMRVGRGIAACHRPDSLLQHALAHVMDGH